MLSHYSGYEWCVSLPYFIKHHVVGVYSPMSNKKLINLFENQEQNTECL